MIAGLGIDIVDVPRFAVLLEEPGSAFANRTFTAAEQAAASSRPSREPAMHLAARYAAKEACIKALSQALAPAPLPAATASLLEAEVLLDASGRPQIALAGRLRDLAEGAGIGAVHVSLTHEGSTAAAVVILERRPR